MTLAAVAKRAGVTPTLVSAFFKKSYDGPGGAGGASIGISGATRARILAAARHVGFLPRDADLRLSVYPEAGDTCYLVPNVIEEGIANPYYARFATAIMEKLDHTGRTMLVSSYDLRASYQANGEDLPTPFRVRQASRAILAGNGNDSLAVALLAQGTQVVQLSQPSNTPGVASFVPDFAAAPAVALGHLRELGHEAGRIRVASGKYMPNKPYAYRQLLAGTLRAWRELWPDAPMPEICHVALPMKDEAMAEWLAADRRMTAIYCFDDYTAHEIMGAALRLGHKVPARLSVVGTNNQNGADRQAVPTTTVDVGAREIGRAAVEYLDAQTFARIQEVETELGGGAEEANATREEIPFHVIPVRLVKRASAAPPPR